MDLRWTAFADVAADIDPDLDGLVGADDRIGLVGIAMAVHAGSPVVQQPGCVAGGQGGGGAPARWLPSVVPPTMVVVDRLATLGEPWPPPHPANPRAATAARTASPADRRHLGVISRPSGWVVPVVFSTRSPRTPLSSFISFV